jgi:hypothetical protein
MQTFLPYPDFKQSAVALDRKRLGKQRVEVLQIFNALKRGGGWSNHPAVNMWRGFEDALLLYGREMCREWISRGYKDTLLPRFEGPEHPPLPEWVGDEAFHSSHRYNLLRKDSVHYGRFNWTEGPDLPYKWPRK